jgi:hypothetical protein
MVAAHDADADDTDSKQIVRVVFRGLYHVASPTKLISQIPAPC